MIKAALKKHEIDGMKPLDEGSELQVLSTLIKQRRESADMFRKGGRAELADKEETELKLIESYMPSAPSSEEIDQAIAERHGGNRRHVAEADGRGDEGGASQARRQARGRQGAERKSAGAAVVRNRLSER